LLWLGGLGGAELFGRFGRNSIVKKIKNLGVSMVIEDTAVIAPRCRVDIQNYQYYLAQIREALKAGGKEIAVDLSEVTFLDTYGLSVLVKGSKLAQEHRASFRVLGVRHLAVKMVFEVTNIERLFPVVYG
jgi:anti-sigma B factor antagonist